ncbi:MAG: hypothetical protein IKN75_05880 [Prevotella sp.]|nr:hypothetical protein [Prevotella sp.]
MKRKHSFVWIIAALIAVCLTVIMNGQEQEAVSRQNKPEQRESSVMVPQQQQPHEATLTDATQLYRVCTSRPQRLLPTQGSRSERFLTPAIKLVRQYILKPLHSHHDSRCRMESAPFALSASRDYYVIALRHIIR